MTTADLIQSQLTDPFRVGMIAVLFFVMLRTRASSGVWMPLAAGALFVAVLIPMNGLGGEAAKAVDFTMAVTAGVFSNAMLIAVIMGLWTVYENLNARR